MEILYPDKLKPGDEVRVIAPSHSLAIISAPVRELATKRLVSLGLKVTFGNHAEEIDSFTSSSIESRLSDLHDAFADKQVKAIFAVIGGFNSNQLLKKIDWDLIKRNPKVLIGYSDTTALENAIFAKTGLVTYSGPAYSTFGQELYFDYTLEYFKKCLMVSEPIVVTPSAEWTDDQWYLDQTKRTLIGNEGWIPVSEGDASGRLLGGNLTTFRLLHGTEFFPDISNSVLFLEDDEASGYVDFDRSLQALVYHPNFSSVRGLVIGRFQKKSAMDRQKIERLIECREELKKIPVLANVDFGHTSPIITFPIGGEVSIEVHGNTSRLTIKKH